MSVTPIWDNEEKTIIRHVFQDRWTIGDIWQSAGEAWHMMRTVEHRVHAILDLRAGNMYPSGVLSLSNRILSQRPSNAGSIVLVGSGGLVRMLVSAFRKTYARLHPTVGIHVVDTLEEAYAIINTYQADH